MFEIGRLTRLAMGYESESNSRPIEICVADWLADWPGATIGLLLMRPGEDTYYPAASKVVDGVLHFTPSRADMAIPGDGLAQIVMTDENDVELRSRVVRTMIECSLPGSEAEAPEEPMRPFVDQVLEAAASAVESADLAGKAAGNAAADAGRAEAAADNAEAAAKRAEEAASMIGPGGGGTGTVTSVNGVQPDEAGNVEMEIPQAAEDVGADPAGTAASKVSTHNADEDAHPHIQQLISDLAGRLNALADSDDTTLDQLSEIVAYIKSNKALIDSITTGKVSVADIVNNLTSTATNKPLSAAQGKALKALIDAIVVPTKLRELAGDTTHRVVTDAEKTAWNAKSTFSGKYADLTGKPTKVSAFENDAGYLTEHQDISHLLPRTELGAAVDVALAEAKASGAFDGKNGEDGYTPVAGVDYYTPDDKAEFTQYIASEMAKRGQLKPEFANSIDDCTDESKLYVLPDGYIYAYIATVTEGEDVPNFTNIFNTANGAYIKNGYRYSHSSAAFKVAASDCVIVVPVNVAASTAFTIRAKTATFEGCNYPGSVYFSADGNQKFALTGNDTNLTRSESDGVVTWTHTAPAAIKYVIFHVAAGVDESSLIVTLNQEITYTPVAGGTTYKWANTGHAFVPADYEDRIVDLESGLAEAKDDIETLQNKVGNVSASANATTAFSTPAYAPVPQQPADGTYDFHGLNVTTAQAHAYMDALASKHKGYVTKQTMGKDQSGAYDHNRYVLCKSYWRAWLKPNYPMMFAWKNGSTVIYSVSVSPRVGDTMYTTPYIGTAYSTVTAVNHSTPDAANSIPGTPSTRTVNGLVFARHTAGDVEPTVVYTKVASSLSALNSGDVYDAGFGSITKVTAYTKEAITCANGIVYTRYPFEDLRADKTKPLSVFVLANEHGHWGDNKVPSISLMRMAKDLCENRENPFLQWLKENATITMIPVGNPWGYDPSAGDSGAGYNNSRCVNINRNYDTPGWAGSDNNYGDDTTFGAYPGSENETQHIMNTMHLCKAKVGLSMHGLGLGQSKTKATEYTEGLMWQGCGYDKSRMTKVAEVLFSDYGQLIGGHTTWDQSYEYCGKSPAYIQYVGAVGGLNEIPDIETGTLDLYTPTVMEAAYTQMLLFLQTWCEEALEKE